MKKINKECEGCSINSICILKTSRLDSKTNENIKCPCMNCLLKVMCSVICKEYKDYVTIRTTKWISEKGVDT